MKVFSISGFLLSLISFLMGFYLQFILAPAAESLEVSLETGISDEVTAMMYMAAHQVKVDTGERLVIIGGVAFILCLIPAIKLKSKLAIIGLVLSVAGLFAGLIHGTHMFS